MSRRDYRLTIEGGRARIVRSSALRRVIALPLLALDAGFVHLALTGQFKDSSGQPAPIPLVVALALLFTLASIGLLTYVSGVEFEKFRGVCERWWGFVTPWKRTQYPLTSFADVWLAKEIHSNGKSSSTVYPVRLSGTDTLLVYQSRSADAARACAEEVAKHLELPLRSTVRGDAVVRPWRELDWSVRRRLVHAGTPTPLPRLPTGSRLSATRVDDGYDVDIPAVGLGRSGLWLILFVAPLPVVFVAVALTSMGDAPWFVPLVVSLVALIPVALVVGLAAYWGLARETLRLRRDTVTVERRLPWTSSTWTRPTESVEEISGLAAPSSPLGSLIATGGPSFVTDDGECGFARGTTSDERQYLHDLFAHVVCRGAGGAIDDATAS